ncbi:MAG: hypothetical protein GY930_17785 [bacterium]|nr:hypothetical protein [bacterium]
MLFLLALLGLWWIQNDSEGMKAMSADGPDNPASGAVGERTALGPEPQVEPKKVATEPEDEPGQPGSGQKLKSQRKSKGRRRARRPKKSEKPVAPKVEGWIVVNAYGQGVSELKFNLHATRGRLPFLWQVESDAIGRFQLPKEALHEEMRFQAITSEGEDHTLEILDQTLNMAFPKKGVVRVLEKGELLVWVMDKEEQLSDMSYSTLLFPHPKSTETWYPHHGSSQSEGGQTEMSCPPMTYELGLAPEGSSYLSVRASMLKPALVHIQSGRETHLVISEPDWLENEWSVRGQVQRSAVQLVVKGSTPSHSSILSIEQDIAPRWRVPSIPKWVFTVGLDQGERRVHFHELFLLPATTIAQVVQGGNGEAIGFLNTDGIRACVLGGSVLLGQGPGSLRSIALDSLAGVDVKTTVRSLTKFPGLTPAPFSLQEVTRATIKHRTPEWLEIKAEYAKDFDWLRAQATIVLSPNGGKLKLARLICPTTLDLRDPETGRETPPAYPGLRWSYGFPSGEMRRFQVDLLPNADLQFAIPFPRNAGNHEGLLSWVPQSKPGVFAIGEWAVQPTHRRDYPTPGFRTFNLQCLSETGEAVPFAMVQASSGLGTLWKGSADGEGRLRLEVLGPGPYWIDTALVQNPVQLQIDHRNTPTHKFQLVVPVQDNEIHLRVTGNLPLHILKARLSIWKPSRKDRERIFPAFAEENLAPDGHLTFQGLIPGKYKIEVFDPRHGGAQHVLQVEVTDRDREPIAELYWLHEEGK